MYVCSLIVSAGGCKKEILSMPFVTSRDALASSFLFLVRHLATSGVRKGHTQCRQNLSWSWTTLLRSRLSTCSQFDE